MGCMLNASCLNCFRGGGKKDFGNLKDKFHIGK